MAKPEDDKVKAEAEAKAKAEAEAKAADEKARAEAAAKAESGLVKMVKDGEELAVDPSCVRAHEEAGWKVKR